VRLYTLFIGPPEKESEWSEEGVVGAFRFLNRVHDLCSRVHTMAREPVGERDAADTPLTRFEHRTIRRVTEDAERFHFHTAVAALMELQRAIAEALDSRSEAEETLVRATKTLLKLLHPIAPHITEEWWERVGEQTFLLETPWPKFEPELARTSRVTLVVQVNGRVRGKLDVERGEDEAAAVALARRNEKIRPWVEGKEITRAVYVPDRLLNLVVR
jgi:leucyl-tRNA synthetase